jgi:protein SCO1/2
MVRGGWPKRVLTTLFVLASFSPSLSMGNQNATPPNPARDYFTDTILVDQDARPHRFYSDLIAGRTVVINLIFTGCRSSCPIIMGRLLELQDLLGDKANDVSILSISVDPVMDTPQALHAYAESLQAGPGWYFLTGSRDSVETVLRRMGNRSSSPEDHTDLIVVGNDRSGTWIKLTAIATTEDIAQAVAEVASKQMN